MVLINFSSYYNYAFWIDNFKVFERAAHKEKKDKPMISAEKYMSQYEII